jgi:predicted ArsR family transcriptional regulator
MASEAPRLTDPKRLRALSHPLRWKLLTLIGDEDTFTATQCAEELGESVASCSYHLNMLAKYGFIEEAEGGQGREKPWKSTATSMSISPEGLDEEGARVAEAAGEAYLEQEFETIRARMATRRTEPEEWRKLTSTWANQMYLTAEEAAELSGRLTDVLQEYQDRWNKPDGRPADARRVHYLLATTVAPRRKGQ